MARKPAVTPNPSADQVKDAVENGLTPVIRVVGPSVGRRRAGYHFGPEPVDLPLADLTEDQVLALQADPALLTGITAVPTEADAAAADGDASPAE